MRAVSGAYGRQVDCIRPCRGCKDHRLRLRDLQHRDHATGNDAGWIRGRPTDPSRVSLIKINPNPEAALISPGAASFLIRLAIRCRRATMRCFNSVRDRVFRALV